MHSHFAWAFWFLTCHISFLFKGSINCHLTISDALIRVIHQLPKASLARIMNPSTSMLSDGVEWIACVLVVPNRFLLFLGLNYMMIEKTSVQKSRRLLLDWARGTHLVEVISTNYSCLPKSHIIDLNPSTNSLFNPRRRHFLLFISVIEHNQLEMSLRHRCKDSNKCLKLWPKSIWTQGSTTW